MGEMELSPELLDKAAALDKQKALDDESRAKDLDRLQKWNDQVKQLNAFLIRDANHLPTPYDMQCLEMCIHHFNVEPKPGTSE